MSHGAEHPEPGAAVGRRYSAFISYSHADAAFAKRLHRQLETYRLPARLTARAGARLRDGRLRPLFRDDDELEAAADLTAAVRDALGRSECLIVVCSPHAKASPWVAREIALFRTVHPDGPVLAALAEGEPGEAFPPALTEAGREPLAADFRGDGSARRLALIKLVAVLAGVPLDELVQRDAQRRMQTLAFAAGGAVATIAVVAGLSVAALTARATAEAERKRAGGLNEFMISDLRKGLEAAGRHDLLDKVNKAALGAYADEDLSKLTPEQQLQRAKTLQGMAKDSEKKGDLAAARAQAEGAHAVTASLLAAKPSDPDRLFAHAQSEYWLGFVAWREGDGREAKARFEAYARLAERLLQTDPTNDEWRTEVISASANRGMLALRQAGDPIHAEGFFRASLSQIDGLTEGNQHTEDVQKNRSTTLGWLADSQRLQGNLNAALASREAQRKILETMLRENPRSVEVKRQLLGNELAIARIVAQQGDSSLAISMLKAGREKALSLAAQDPDNRDFPKQARMFELFRARISLGLNPSPRDRKQIAETLGDCAPIGNGADSIEISDFCRVLLARLLRYQGDEASAEAILTEVREHQQRRHDVYTARWGLDLRAEASRVGSADGGGR